MSFVGKNKKNINKNNSVSKSDKHLENKIKALEKKMEIKLLENNSLKNLEQKMENLENENKNLVKMIKNLPKKNTDDKILKNIINNDLNKMKIKIEKNEDIIKKILFN